MPRVTIQLTRQEIEALKARTGKTSAGAALKEWAELANPRRAVAKLRVALKAGRHGQAAAKERRFRSGREAIRWLEH
jgi:hypothetical protein